MKLLVIVSLIIAAVAAAPSRNFIPVREALGLSPRIIAGENAVLGQFPWQAQVSYTVPEGTGLCGGALINVGWVLTAGHCVDRAFNSWSTFGSLYSDGRNEPQAIVVNTNEVIIHPNYVRPTLTNDVALLRLSTNVKLSKYIKLIPLESEQIESGVLVTASGWGKTSDDSDSSLILNHVMVTTINNAECIKTHEHITEGNLCCVGAPMHSTCYGDSGGPLVKYDPFLQASHVGIISYGGQTSCAAGDPSVYVRTSYYRDWILNEIS